MIGRRMAAVAAAALVVGAAPAKADPFDPRETARALAPGAWQVGVFNPLRVGLRWVELELHPLLWLVAPHADVKVPIAGGGPDRWEWSARLGLGVPSAAWRLAKPFGLAGDLVPSCKVAAHEPARGADCHRPGWLAVPKIGLLATRSIGPAGGESAITLSAEIAAGLPLVGEAARPLDAWAPIDVALAPSLGRTRAQLRAAVDLLATPWLRLRGELTGIHVSRPADDPLSTLTASAYAGLDLRTSAHTRVTAGAMYWNTDRRQREVTKGADGFAFVRYVRSHEVWPTVDFLWSY